MDISDVHSADFAPQLTEAHRRVAAAVQAGSDELDLGGLRLDDSALEQLLPEMGKLEGLRRLYLGLDEEVRKKGSPTFQVGSLRSNFPATR